VEGEEGRRREAPRSQEEDPAAVVGVWRKEKKQNCVLCFTYLVISAMKISIKEDIFLLESSKTWSKKYP
jgi:hypothetical protein